MPSERSQTEQHMGPVAIAEALRDIKFPVTIRELTQQAGQKKIQWIPGTTDTLEQLLANTSQNTFYSITDVVSAISQPDR